MKGGYRLGQVRIIEAVTASILIFIAFTAAFFMLFSSEKFFRQETVDLDRLAYNVLHRLAESGVIDESIEEGRYNEVELRSALQNLLPQNLYFNLTIRERDASGLWRPYPPISNAPSGVFESPSEVASASIIYTSKEGKIYYLSLVLARAGLT
ncbi:MAG: hypothetical protein N3E47_03085 [Candidatus Bathyarchaeota archaeon]|nr:hypothetical protein [Candidatus Bathyarchaeota archaeon]